jgi:Rrf2 family protein
MRLSRTVVYAIQAVIYLGQMPSGEAIPCSRLAREGNMPERFLLHVLRALVKNGILNSTRGVDGGYCLARSPERISLRDLVVAFDDLLMPELPNLNGQSLNVREQLVNTLQRVSNAAGRELQKLSLAELINRNGSG